MATLKTLLGKPNPAALDSATRKIGEQIRAAMYGGESLTREDFFKSLTFAETEALVADAFERSEAS